MEVEEREGTAKGSDYSALSSAFGLITALASRVKSNYVGSLVRAPDFPAPGSITARTPDAAAQGGPGGEGKRAAEEEHAGREPPARPTIPPVRR